MANSLKSWSSRAALLPGSSAPAAVYAAGTNFPRLTLDFDQTSAEKCYFYAVVPQIYAGGNIDFDIWWTAAATGNVVWGIKYLGRVNDEVFDAAISSQTTVTDGVTASNDIMLATVSVSSPTLAAGDWLVVELERVAANASDTLAADAKFIHLELQEQ